MIPILSGSFIEARLAELAALGGFLLIGLTESLFDALA